MAKAKRLSGPFRIAHTQPPKRGGLELKRSELSAEATRPSPGITQKDLTKLDALGRKKGIYGLHREGILRELQTFDSLDAALARIKSLKFMGKGVTKLEEPHLAAIENLLKSKGWK
ncbi:MAG: hypothetical protein V1834_04910 [Candidatus Micrarchaeota archaeon]